jgi:hypothetical protein
MGDANSCGLSFGRYFFPASSLHPHDTQRGGDRNGQIGTCYTSHLATDHLRHPDPVVEIGLLKDRNFAIANAYYFLFGFLLYGATVLIPQMLQSLYGYTATDAGLVLGPGALVIVILAPVVVRLVNRIPVSRLIGLGFALLGLSMWYFASFNLATDYAREAWARALTGLGIAFMFVPISQLAYSYLPKEKNNKASSLTNLYNTRLRQARSLVTQRQAQIHAARTAPQQVTDARAKVEWSMGQVGQAKADLRTAELNLGYTKSMRLSAELLAAKRLKSASAFSPGNLCSSSSDIRWRDSGMLLGRQRQREQQKHGRDLHPATNGAASNTLDILNRS